MSSETVETASGRVVVEFRREGGIERWVAPFYANGAWSAQDTYHERLADAVADVLRRFGSPR